MTTGNPEANPPPRPEIKNARYMDDEFFCKHWNKRHRHLMPKGNRIPLGEGPTDTPYIIGLYRTYHDTIHRQEVGQVFDHEHKG